LRLVRAFTGVRSTAATGQGYDLPRSNSCARSSSYTAHGLTDIRREQDGAACVCQLSTVKDAVLGTCSAAAWLLQNVIADSVIQKVACGTHRLMYGATVHRHLRNTPDSRSVTVPLCLWRFHGISADPTHFEFGMCLFWYVMSGLRVSASSKASQNDTGSSICETCFVRAAFGGRRSPAASPKHRPQIFFNIKIYFYLNREKKHSTN
jgi:hypothetical protein